MNRRKGFTIVELLAAVVILGILTTIAISAVINLTKNAKDEKDKQNVNNLRIAAESYAQANKEYLPRLIGESTRIEIKDLSENKYLKEEIKNQNDESCMKNSYVEVTKVSKTDYKYIPHLLCGSSTTEDNPSTTEPVITIKINEGTKVKKDDLSFTSENLKDANYSITFKGDKSDKNVGIVSYNYSLFVSKNEKGSDTESEKFEVFNSGNLLGNNEPEISVNNVSISEYLNMTGENHVEVRAFLVNSEGDKTVETEKIKVFESGNVVISDNTAPICPDSSAGRVGEPGFDNWLNKKDIKEGKTRIISLTCNDQQGSGCKRKNFSRTWPSKEEKENKTSIVDSTITLTDNNDNSYDCPVKVNIDVTSPAVSILKDNHIKKNITIEENNDYNTLIPTKTIESDDKYYNNLYENKWMNSVNYPDGIEYTVQASDDIGIKRIAWETNKPQVGDNNDEQLDLYISENSNIETTKDSNGRTVYTLKVRFSHDGIRQGVITVEDHAGNKSIINVNASIDRERPQLPKVNFYKWKGNSEENFINLNTDKSKLTTYEPESWSKYKIYTESEIAKDTVSGVDDKNYYYTTTGKTTNDNLKSGRYRNIEAEGKSTIKYTIYDNAGNSITTPEYKVYTDYTAPTCRNTSSCKIGGKEEDCPTWINKANKDNSSVTIAAICEDSHEGKENSGCVKAEAGRFEYKAEEDIYTTNAGAGGIGVKVYAEDNAGNKTECPTNATIKIDITDPPIPSIEVYQWKSNSVSPRLESELGKKLTIYTESADNNEVLCKQIGGCQCASTSNCDWSSLKIYTRPYYDSETKKILDKDTSGFNKYQYTALGATTNSNDLDGNYRKIEADGSSTIKWRTCDKAGNCSNYNKPTLVKVSKHRPTISCTISSTDGTIGNVSITPNASGNNQTYYVRSMATTKEGIQAAWATSQSYYGKLDKSNKSICGRTYYAYIKTIANDGMVQIEKCKGSFKTNSCNNCATNPTECPWVTTCRAGHTALYFSDIDTWAGTAYHSLNGRNDRLYVLEGNKADTKYAYGIKWIRVYVPSFDNYYSGDENKYVYVAANCIGPYNQVCPYTQCPG